MGNEESRFKDTRSSRNVVHKAHAKSAMDSKKVKLRGYGNSKLWQENDCNSEKRQCKFLRQVIRKREMENVGKIRKTSGKTQGWKSRGRHRAKLLENFRLPYNIRNLCQELSNNFHDCQCRLIWYKKKKKYSTDEL